LKIEDVKIKYTNKIKEKNFYGITLGKIINGEIFNDVEYF